MIGQTIYAVDSRTLEAVKKEVTEADIPVLIKLSGDKENVVGIGARNVSLVFSSSPALGVDDSCATCIYLKDFCLAANNLANALAHISYSSPPQRS